MRVLLLFTMLFFMLGCTKDEKIGPQGEQGIPGKDGSLIYSGTGVPHVSTGKVGDYYLDVANGNLYGPKTDGGWGSFFNLKGEKGEEGPKGEAGEKGSSLLSGPYAPTNTIGVVGDYFLNKTNLELFGPKTSTGWGTPVSLASDLGVRLIYINPDFHNNYKMLNDTLYSASTKFYEIDLKGKNLHADFYWFNPPKGWSETEESVRTWTLMNGIFPIPTIDYSFGQYRYIHNVEMFPYTISSAKGFEVKFYIRANTGGGDFVQYPMNMIFMVKLVPVSSYERVSNVYSDVDKYFSFSAHRAKLPRN